MLAALAAPANAALDLPAHPQGPVLDQANLLNPAQQAQLDAKLRAFDARTGDAVIVATVNSLHGDSIDDYAVRLYSKWGIGGAGIDKGVLILVAPNERRVKIEVGYGLEPYLTDILSGRIIRNDMTPRFKAGDMAGGINAGVDAILKQLSLSPADAKAVANAAAVAAKNNPQHQGGIPPGGIAWLLFLLFFIFISARARRGGRRYGGGGIGNVLLWTAMGAAMGSADRNSGGGFGGGGLGGGGGGGFGGFGGGMSGGGGASGGW